MSIRYTQVIGPCIRYICDTLSDLPTNAFDGSEAFVIDTSTEYYRDGGSWVTEKEFPTGTGTSANPYLSNAYFNFSRSSGNWALPGWVSPIKVGVADLSDDDGQPWLVCQGWISKNLDVGFRLETPNGTICGGLIGYSTHPECLAIFVQGPTSKIQFPTPNQAVQDSVFPSNGYSVLSRDDSNSQIRIESRDGSGNLHTTKLPFGSQRIIASGETVLGNLATATLATTFTRLTGERVMLYSWIKEDTAGEEFSDYGLVFGSSDGGAGVGSWFRKTGNTNECQLWWRNTGGPITIQWTIVGLVPPS